MSSLGLGLVLTETAYKAMDMSSLEFALGGKNWEKDASVWV